MKGIVIAMGKSKPKECCEACGQELPGEMPESESSEDEDDMPPESDPLMKIVSAIAKTQLKK
jgi:hypothetical protein